MTKIDPLSKNEIRWQGDFSAARDESGQWSARHSFKCRPQDAIEVTPDKGTPCTKNGWSLLTLNTATITETAGDGWAMVACMYKGTIITGDGSEFDEGIEPTYNTSRTAQSEPIESHDNFKALTASEWAQIADYKAENIIHDPDDVAAFKKRVLDSDGNRTGYEEDVTLTAPQIQLISALDEGFTSYFSPRTTHTIRYVSNTSYKSSEYAKVGAIVPAPEGAPTLPPGATWLFLGANTDNSGSIYDIELEYIASSPAGWNTDFY